MRIKGKFASIVAGCTKGSRKDGSGNYYSVSIIDPETSEAGMLSADEDVYNAITSKDFKKYNEYVLRTEYDSTYKWLRVVGLDLPK